MNYRIPAGKRSGEVTVPSSKSMLHRLLIAAALSQQDCKLFYRGLSADVSATINCLRALGASIEPEGEGIFHIRPMHQLPSELCNLDCGESGSTLRFLLPVAGALGCAAAFYMASGLAKRPTDALLEVMDAHGVQVTKKKTQWNLAGALTPGDYSITGSISSQYVSGLLMALPLLHGESTLEITGSVASYEYIRMTEHVLYQSGIRFQKTGNRYRIPGNQRYGLQGEIPVEADWSGAAYFLCMGAFSQKGITVRKLHLQSMQADREIRNLLERFGAEVTATGNSITVRKGSLSGLDMDADAIPDLVPTVCAAACFAEGVTTIKNAGRLRLKESDRLETTARMLRSLGAEIEIIGDRIRIAGKRTLPGGTVDAANDHRIAMAAAVAACGCEADVIVQDAECVSKSYPDFWKDFAQLEVER